MKSELLLTRRGFLLTTGFGLVGVPLLYRYQFPWLHKRNELFLASINDANDKSYIAALDSSGKIRFELPVGSRCHGVAINPKVHGEAVVFPKRPGYVAYLTNFQTGQIVKEFRCEEGRYFYGHGCYSADGRYLFATENDYENQRGVVTIRDGATMQVLGELPSFGVGPHEVTLLNDGKTLVIANGGTFEHPNSGGREILNVETMRPSLAYVDLESNKLLGEYRLENHYLGMRHLSVRSDGLIAIAIQNEGPAETPTPLIAFHDGKGELRLGDAPLEVLREMNHFGLSVCMDPASGITGLTCPKGNVVAFWNAATGEFLRRFSIQDASGITLTHDKKQFMITNGLGQVVLIPISELMRATPVARQFEGLKWDNHISVPISI